MRVAGLILAGGESRRMGALGPKAALTLGGRSFLACGVHLLRAGGCDPILAVDGAHRILEAHAGVDLLVHNPEWRRGPLSSLQIGVASLGPVPVDGVVVHRVEQPAVDPRVIADLIAAWQAEPDAIWQPSVDGRSGHPVLWPRAAFEAIAALDSDRHTARDLLRSPAWAAHRRKLPVEDPGVLDNVDTPDDLARLRARLSS